MSRAYVSNMEHFLNEHGQVSETLPKPLRRLVDHLGKIIAYTTNHGLSRRDISVSCWNLINRKRCSGKIDAEIDLANFQILWHCLVCGDHGSITHWERTLWDENDTKTRT